MSVEVTGLSKIYGSQKAVNNISFNASNGEILGFLGPNGAGKSTTMKMATCFVPPTSGDIKICGESIFGDTKLVRSKIGYLPEHNPLYLDMYVHEYLNFVATTYGMSSSLRKQRVPEMVELFGLTKEQNKQIGALSKGYRQRVGLAQSLIHDPEVLILDEPTTGLDPNQLVEIRALIKKISANKTVIFSTHIMQEVQALCDRVVIINKGEIVANEEVKSLMATHDSSTVLSVQFTDDIEINKLTNIEGVNNVEGKGNGTYLISSDKTIDVRSALFDIIKQENWSLLEMKQQASSLEQIFQNLTGNN